jgi:hypothetical protein
MTRNSLALALSTVALVVAAAGTGGPAIAGVFASDSHRVDGKHAVGARASVANRAGKLVATNGAGRLPNNIITKAPNADRLDGLDSSALLRKSSPAGSLTFLGQVSSTGVLHAGSVGISGASRGSTGNYTVTLPGVDPGCAGTAFVVSLQPFGAALANSGAYSTTCATGDVNYFVNTQNLAGTAVDSRFDISVFVLKTPATARRTAWTACTTTPSGRSCS